MQVAIAVSFVPGDLMPTNFEMFFVDEQNYEKRIFSILGGILNANANQKCSRTRRRDQWVIWSDMLLAGSTCQVRATSCATDFVPSFATVPTGRELIISSSVGERGK